MSNNTTRLAPSREQDDKGPALAGILSRLRGLMALVLCLSLSLGVLPAPAMAAEIPTTYWRNNADTDWYNELETEFTLTTAAQLAGVAKLIDDSSTQLTFENKVIRLGNDIDLSDHRWSAVGDPNNIYNKFAGEFDGAGYTVRGMICDYSNLGGLFGAITSTAKVHDLQIKDAIISTYSSSTNYVGLVASYSEGSIYNCAVSGSIKCVLTSGSGYGPYVGGLVGSSGGGSIKNCVAQISSVDVTSENDSPPVSGYVGGIVGSMPQNGSVSVENCFAVLDVLTAQDPSKPAEKYQIAAQASFCYWDSASALKNPSNLYAAPNYTQCYPVTDKQMAGTGGGTIGTAPYANVNSVTDALNAWVAANNADGGYDTWMTQNGRPMLSLFYIPDYIDITVVPEQDKEGIAGSLSADVILDGQVQEKVELISVTLPASIPFIMDVDASGALKRLLSATATLTNRSDAGVTVTLTDVVDSDPTPLLDKLDIVLIPDPDPTGNPVTLTAGTGKTDVLAILDAPADGVPTTSLLKVGGAAKADAASIGGDGDSFTIGLTLKAVKIIPST